MAWGWWVWFAALIVFAVMAFRQLQSEGNLPSSPRIVEWIKERWMAWKNWWMT